MLKRDIGKFALTLAGVTGIIGSGWLFGAYHSAQIAGPAALLSWLIGGITAILIGLTIAELGVLFPHTGGMARYLEYTHGSFAGFIMAWINWIGVVAVIPTEAAASVQYLSSRPGFSYLFDYQARNLSYDGLLFASVLVLIFFLFNYWSLKLFIRSMVTVTLFKIIVPVITFILLMFAAFHPANFGHNAATFAPYGYSAVVIALSSGGIIYAFNGFQIIVNLAGEARRPKDIRFAVLASIVLCLAIYLCLQAAFIGSISPASLQQGWHNINFSSPFVQIAMLLNLNFLSLLLYIDAFISPSGVGLAYMASSSRMLFAMEKNGYMPKWFGHLDPVYHMPRNALWLILLLSFAFLWIFKAWGNLAAILSVANSLSYISGPIALASVTKLLPKFCKARGGHPVVDKILAPLGFIIVSLIFYWSSWPLNGQVMLATLAGLVFYFYYRFKKNGIELFLHDLRPSLWLVLYFISMLTVSYFGAAEFGGRGIIHSETVNQLLVVGIALVFYIMALRSGFKTALLSQILAYPEDEAPKV